MVTTSIELRVKKYRRSVAKWPLATLLQWVLVNAMRPHLNQPPTRQAIDCVRYDARRILRELADARAFSYFGIWSADEFGNPPIGIAMVHGELVIQYEPLIEWIFGGGASAHGWTSPFNLNLLKED